MTKRGDAGVGMVAVILLAVVASVTVLVSWYEYEDLERMRSVNDRLKKLTAEANKQATDVENRAKDLATLVGFKIEGKFEERSVEEVKSFETAERAAYQVVGDTAGLQEELQRAGARASELALKLELAEHEKGISQRSAAAAKERKNMVQAIKDAEIARLRDKFGQLQKQLSDEGTAYANRIQSMTTQSRQLDDDLATLERKQADERMRKQNEVNKTKADLAELLKKEAIVRDFTEVQGTVVDSDTRREYAVINLGSPDRIVPGLKFRVFRKDKGGLKRWKGEVEVKQVFGDYSRASITQLSSDGDPLVHGDFITNPLYGREKPKRVVIAGKISGKTFPYEMDELRRRIAATGAVLEDTVSIFTDYVLRGQEAEEDANFKTAVDLSVPVMAVQEILPYIAD
ncbi:MAG: hypothetical protein HYZ53_26600 [Planctomycetes bacterium]|nr:hypothetical protein [Planctomycetota bacterium]